MKRSKIFFIVICISAILIPPLQAQIFLGLLDFSSLVTSSDASDVAMGESFVAYPYGVSAFTHNPANLMGVTGVNGFYHYRDNEASDILNQSGYKSYGATMATAIGNFGFIYQHSLFGRFAVVTAEAPDIVFSQAELSDYNLNFSYARNFSEQLTLGAAVKWYDAGIKTVSGPPIPFDSKNAVALDIGAVYWIPGFVTSREVTDHFFFGASIQNFGTDFESKFEGQESYGAQQLPRFFRFGFAYRLHAQSPGTSFSFKYFLTGEYRRYLNPGDEYDKSNCDFGGLGFKAMFFDIFSLQLGGYYSPDDTFTSQEDKLNIRYGFDINLALKQFGADYPINFLFQFAHIPVNNSFVLTESGNTKNLPVFSLQISYTESIF